MYGPCGQKVTTWIGGSVPKSMTPQQEDTHFRVLRLLQVNPQITQRELSQKLGVSLGATNYVLRALLDKGAIKIQNFQASRKKLSYVYLLTPTGISEKARLTTQFLARKRAEYEALKAEIEAVIKDAEEGEVVR
jgi:EPS-associated MarR family transcriptional regulator